MPLRLQRAVFVRQITPMDTSEAVLFPIPLLPSFHIKNHVVLSCQKILYVFPMALQGSSLPSFSGLRKMLNPERSSAVLFAVFSHFSFLLFYQEGLSHHKKMFLLPDLEFPSDIFQPLTFLIPTLLPIQKSRLFLSQRTHLSPLDTPFFYLKDKSKTNVRFLPVFHAILIHLLIPIHFYAYNKDDREAISLYRNVLEL